MRPVESGQRLFSALLLCAALSAVCCGREKILASILPQATPFFARGVVAYGVVSANYAQVLSEPKKGEASAGFLRRGSLVDALERRRVKDGEAWKTWVLVRSAAGGQEAHYRGWLPEEALSLYDTRRRAENAARDLVK